MVQNTHNPLQKIDSSAQGLIGRVLKVYLKPHLRQIMWAVLFMVIGAMMTAGFAKLVEPILDNVLTDKQEHLIVPVSLAVFAIFLINGLATYLHTIVMNRVGQSVVTEIQKDLFAKLLILDLRFFHENPSGQLVSRLVNDTTAMRAAVTDGLTGIGKSILTLILLVGLMFMQDARLALAVCIIFPMAGFVVRRVGRKLRRISGNTQAEIASMTHVLAQIFQGMRQVKAYGMATHEAQRAGKIFDRVRNLTIKGVRTGTMTTPINEALIGLAITGVIMYGGFRVVVAGDLTTGQLMSFITAFSLAYEPMKRLAKLSNTLQMGLGAAERVFSMMDCEPEIKSKPTAITLQTAKPEIRFENVKFQYGSEEGHAALRGIDFAIPSGKVTALVGPSGGGKTTIMNLIPRFYDVTFGRITVDGTDIRDVTLESLRRNIAFVSQDITIFDDTVRANILYGRMDASESDVIAAAKAAAAHDFIAALPEGYDTRLGENGVKLSGGQRQRVAIARAILRDAPILLLDEATSALDNESERLIQASLAELQRGRTSLVIAHRLSTVQHADQIIVLEQGKIVETGCHDALVGMGGMYARMHKAALHG